MPGQADLGAGGQVVCADCAEVESLFACPECGREDHPYGHDRCARCFLRERLAALLADPTSGHIHALRQPVFDALVGAERPQTGVYWLRRKPGVGPPLLGRMAGGEMDISRDAFRAFPSDKPHNYVRDLLVAVGVLPVYEPPYRPHRAVAGGQACCATYRAG